MWKRIGNFAIRMRPKRRWFQFSLCTLFIVVTLYGVWLGDRVDPVRRLERQLAAESEEARVLAARKLGALGSRGKAAETSLARALDDRSAWVRAASIWAMSRIGGNLQRLVPLLSDSDESVRVAASEAIVWGGGDATQVMPTLLDLAVVRGPFDSDTGAKDLVGAFGPEPAASAIPIRLNSAIDADPNRATAAKELIEQLPVPAPRALASLIEASRHECAVVRLAAVEQILRLGPMASEAAGALRELLRDDDPQVAVTAAAALGIVEPNDPECLFILKEGLQTNDHALRLRCVNGLMRLAPSALGACDELLRTLDDDSAEVSMSASDALCRLAALIEIANDKNGEVALQAIESIGQLGPKASLAIEPLAALLASENSVQFGWGGRFVREEAGQALARIGPAAVGSLARELSHHDPRVRVLAAQALGEIGPAAKAAVPALIDRLDDQAIVMIFMGCMGSEREIRSFAIEALGRIGPEASACIGRLVPLLNQPSSVGNRLDSVPVVIAALGRIGPSAKDVVPKLATYAVGDDLEVAEQACIALARIAPDSDRLMRWLGGFVAAIERESSLESSLPLGDFSELIWELGESARPLAGDLRRIAIDSPMHSPWVRYHAAFALARFPDERGAAINYLEDSARDDYVTDGWLAKDMLDMIKVKMSQASDSNVEVGVGVSIRPALP